MDVLTTTEYHDDLGVLTKNVADGLFAIAGALERMAVTQERLLAAQEAATTRMREHNREMHRMVEGMVNDHSDREGHA